MTVTEFVNLWNGLNVSFPNCDDNQCITLVHRFVSEVFRIEDPLVLAQPLAFQIWTNFPNVVGHQYFNQVVNTPTGIPPAGALMIFKPTPDDPAGHISIVLEGATVNSFKSFDANFPWGSKPHIQEHSYTDDNGNDIVYGWLILNNNLVTQDAVPIDDSQQVKQLTDSVNNCQLQLKSATDQNASLQNQLTAETEQVELLQGQLKNANSEITTLQKQLQSEQSEIVHLNQTIETQANTNKNYGQEILDLTHQNTDLKNYLNATADKFGIKRTAIQNADIEEAILKKADELDILLKAANLADGILHSMAKELQLDDPGASDKDIANNIINYVKGLQGKLQNLMPSKSIVEGNFPRQSLWSKLIGWFWENK